MSDKFLTAADIQSRLKVGRSKAYQILNTELPSIRIGRCLRARESDLDQLLECLSRANASSALEDA